MDTPQPPAVTLYVRSLAPRTGRQDRVIDRLRELEAAGRVASVEVTVWGPAVGLSTTAVETGCGRTILNSVAECREWADRSGVSLEGRFEHRHATSEITGEEYTTLRLPALLLAERVDGVLREVRPHEDDGTVQTVEDRLSALAADERAPAVRS
jgi:DNA-binding HxlR family transcriptional regulator